MEIINKIILGIIQGITELLPISSSAHLLITSKYLNFEMSLELLTFLHLATGIAILLGFWKEIKNIFKSQKRNHILRTIIIAILPAGIIGAIFINQIGQYIHNFFPIIILSLIFWGIIMIFIDNISLKQNVKKLEKVTFKNALFIGLIQTFALIPGTSRSGVTIISGIVAGFDRNTAIAFSFIIGLPLVLFSFLLQVFINPRGFFNTLTLENIFVGILSCIFGFLAIYILKRISSMKFLTIFGIYRVLFASTIIILLSI